MKTRLLTLFVLCSALSLASPAVAQQGPAGVPGAPLLGAEIAPEPPPLLPAPREAVPRKVTPLQPAPNADQPAKTGMRKPIPQCRKAKNVKRCKARHARRLARAEARNACQTQPQPQRKACINARLGKSVK